MPELRFKEEDSVESQMLQEGLFKGFKGSLCELVKNQEKAPGGDVSATHMSVSMESIQEMSEIFVLADINR